ncbi:hypothetical protein MASR2M16_24860 [Thauera terpenica]
MNRGGVRFWIATEWASDWAWPERKRRGVGGVKGLAACAAPTESVGHSTRATTPGGWVYAKNASSPQSLVGAAQAASFCDLQARTAAFSAHKSVLPTAQLNKENKNDDS